MTFEPTDDQPYENAKPGSLRERLHDALYPAHESADEIELVVVVWLRDKAEQYGDVSLRNLATYVEDGQA